MVVGEVEGRGGGKERERVGVFCWTGQDWEQRMRDKMGGWEDVGERPGSPGAHPGAPRGRCVCVCVRVRGCVGGLRTVDCGPPTVLVRTVKDTVSGPELLAGSLVGRQRGLATWQSVGRMTYPTVPKREIGHGNPCGATFLLHSTNLTRSACRSNPSDHHDGLHFRSYLFLTKFRLQGAYPGKLFSFMSSLL